MSLTLCKMLIFTLCAVLIFKGSFGAKIEINYVSYTSDTANAAEISCSPDGQETDLKEIVLNRIYGPGNKVLVSIRHGRPMEFDSGIPKRYSATAESSGILKLIIKDPQPSELGSYKCILDYLNNNGDVINHVVAKQLTESDLLSPMQKEFNKLQAEVASLKTTVKELSQRKDAISAFSVYNKRELPVEVKKKIAFPDLIMTRGLDGYNPKTGIYTAPVNGLYAFHLTIEVACRDCQAVINLKANDTVLTSLNAHDKNIYDQSSVSSVVSLNKGDQVYAIPVQLSAANMKIYVYYNHRFSTFTGYLIQPY